MRVMLESVSLECTMKTCGVLTICARVLFKMSGVIVGAGKMEIL